MTLLSLHFQYICYYWCQFFLPCGRILFAVDLLKYFSLTYLCLVYLCTDNFWSLAPDICSSYQLHMSRRGFMSCGQIFGFAQFSFFTCSICSEGNQSSRISSTRQKKPKRFSPEYWKVHLQSVNIKCDIKNNWINNKHLTTLSEFITQSNTILHCSACLTEGNKWCRWKLHCQNALEVKINATKIITKLGEKVKMKF